MFGFGSFGKASRNEAIFEVADVRELVQTFPHKHSPAINQSSDPNELIPLASGEGFVVRSALTRSVKEELGKTDGRIAVDFLSMKLDVTSKDLSRLIHENDTTFLSIDGNSILTQQEIESILEDLQHKTEDSFVPATVFAEQWKLDRKDLIRLVEVSNEYIKEGSLQLLQDPRVPSISTESASYPYIHTLSLLLKVKNDLNGKITSAQEDAKPVSWGFSEMLGLSKKAFCRLAESLFPPEDANNTFHGDFESNEDGVRFIPRSYVLRKVKHHAKEVARGDKPFCDLESLTKLYPKVLPNLQSAREFVETVVHDRDGSPLKFHFISHYAIGNSPLNSTAQTNLEKLGVDRFTNTKPYLRAFPKEIHSRIRVLLHNRTILYYRENGASRGDLVVLGDWLVLSAFITDLASAATRLGKTMAEEQWKAQSENPTFVLTLSPSNFLQRFQEEFETPLELLQQLWEMKDSESISVAAMTSFEKHITDLQKKSHDQFTSLWLSRVVVKSLLYNIGLECLQPGPLKDQLSELLSTHLQQDLIPSTIKRAQTKGLIRTSNLSKQISKLEVEISPSKSEKKLFPQDALTKFAKKISLEAPTPIQITVAKKEHLGDLLSAMNKDKDGPRLFLSMVIVLCASKRDGVVHATGKFAPKLLKAIKDELGEGVYKRAEEIKELVKLGKVDQSVRAEMREIAAMAVKGQVGESVEGVAQSDVKTGDGGGNERWQTIYGDGSNVSLKTAAETISSKDEDEGKNPSENGEGGMSKEQEDNAVIEAKTTVG